MSQSAALRAYDEVVSFFATGPDPAAIAAFQLSPQTIDRVRALLLKKSAGTLTLDEVDELDQCAQLDRIVTLIRSRARQQAQGNKGA